MLRKRSRGHVAGGWIVASAIAVLLFAVGVASAAEGDPVFESCIADTGLSGCTDPPVDPLNGTGEVAVSPGGESVYATGPGSDTITHFTRAANGSLTFESCVANGLPGCADPTIDSLNGARGVSVSPDGNSVYVTSNADDSITHFTRAANGSLTFESCIAEGGLSGCDDPGTVDPLDGAGGVTVSQDGGSVYVASQLDDSITHFTRAANGSLTFESCIAEGGLSGCTDPGTVDSLDQPFGVAATPDGTSVYVASAVDNSITHFTRAANGSLTFESCIANGAASGCVDPPVDALNGAEGVAVDPSGSSVYLASFTNDSITHFTRAANGSLTFENCIAEGGLSGCTDPAIDSLDGAQRVALSPDGRSVYVGSTSDDSITHFNRTATGSLTFVSCVAEAGASGCIDPPIDSLDDARGVAASPDGSSVYVASVADRSVTHFTREPPAQPAQPPSPAEPGDTSPPDTTITKRPKDKTKKKKASFEFNSSEAASTFECRLDGGAFAACTSGQSFKVKRGKHSFEVRAKDAAGNVDATPATDAWKVKKKKKKK